MKISTRTIDVVEMTANEYSLLYTSKDSWPNYNIELWLTDNGNNEIKFKNENFFRPVYLIDET